MIPDHRPAANPRFTVDGSPALEAELSQCCEEVRHRILAIIGPGRLAAILLGGGYGRGEGGVLREPGTNRDLPYNDLEFYVFVRGLLGLAERRHAAALRHLGDDLTRTVGIHVEFKLLTLDRLRRARPSMFYHDLVVGHRRVLGCTDDLRDCDHHRDPALIPLQEATRLLMNRCAGLLFARTLLEQPGFAPEDADFVRRNLAKAALALGDVVLASHGRYDGSCRVRQGRLLGETFPDTAGLPMEDLRSLHADGVRFKLHPVRSRESRAELGAAYQHIVSQARRVWFWHEERRLGLEDRRMDPVGYLESPATLWPETNRVRNILVNLRVWGCRPWWLPEAGSYPRERLLRTLPLLLFEPGCASRPEIHARLCRWLGRPAGAPSLAGWVGRFRAIWQRYG